MPSLMNRLGKFSSVVKSKSAVVKEKMINYIKNEQQPTERLVDSGLHYLALLVCSVMYFRAKKSLKATVHGFYCVTTEGASVFLVVWWNLFVCIAGMLVVQTELVDGIVTWRPSSLLATVTRKVCYLWVFLAQMAELFIWASKNVVCLSEYVQHFSGECTILKRLCCHDKLNKRANSVQTVKDVPVWASGAVE